MARIAFLALLLFPFSSLAELSVCEVQGLSPLILACDLQACSVDGDCAASGFTDPVCGARLVDAPFCRPRCGTVLTCTMDSDCPHRDAIAPECLKPATMFFNGVCVFRGALLDYCTPIGELLTLSQFTACHTTTDGLPVTNYFEGDCDLDGCANGVDLHPCLNDDSVCGAVLPPDVCSLPMIVPDASVGVPDASVVIPDASVPFDAAVATDAGLDGAANESEAGASPVVIAFRGGGGCACALAHRGRPAWPLAIALLLGTVRRARKSH